MIEQSIWLRTSFFQKLISIKIYGSKLAAVDQSTLAWMGGENGAVIEYY